MDGDVTLPTRLTSGALSPIDNIYWDALVKMGLIQTSPSARSRHPCLNSRLRPAGSAGMAPCRRSKRRNNRPLSVSTTRRIRCNHKTTGRHWWAWSQRPKSCIRNDRLSMLQQSGMSHDEALCNETRIGFETMNSGEDPSRFVGGVGRHGKFTDAD